MFLFKQLYIARLGSGSSEKGPDPANKVRILQGPQPWVLVSTDPEDAIRPPGDEEGEALVPGAAHLYLRAGVVHDGIQPGQIN